MKQSIRYQVLFFASDRSKDFQLLHFELYKKTTSHFMHNFCFLLQHTQYSPQKIYWDEFRGKFQYLATAPSQYFFSLDVYLAREMESNYVIPRMQRRVFRGIFQAPREGVLLALLKIHFLNQAVSSCRCRRCHTSHKYLPLCSQNVGLFEAQCE